MHMRSFLDALDSPDDQPRPNTDIVDFLTHLDCFQPMKSDTGSTNEGTRPHAHPDHLAYLLRRPYSKREMADRLDLDGLLAMLLDAHSDEDALSGQIKDVQEQIEDGTFEAGGCALNDEGAGCGLEEIDEIIIEMAEAVNPGDLITIDLGEVDAESFLGGADAPVHITTASSESIDFVDEDSGAAAADKTDERCGCMPNHSVVVDEVVYFGDRILVEADGTVYVDGDKVGQGDSVSLNNATSTTAEDLEQAAREGRYRECDFTADGGDYDYNLDETGQDETGQDEDALEDASLGELVDELNRRVNAA